MDDDRLIPEDLLIPADGDMPVESAELLAASGLAYEELVELVEFGVLQISEGSTGWIFQARAVHQARRVVKLRDSFGLNPPGMALALTYLEKIEALEQRLRELECLLPR
jgi:chaperone modulatory protein CbpM|uniref:chaperone modulator CbpM n=1 Tax=Synechococcus sp. CS-1329 TaxID=2847975 RepID=UPI00223BA0C6|nr:chaperone modulator CbpM [Synechococcus sp. CS-1329]